MARIAAELLREEGRVRRQLRLVSRDLPPLRLPMQNLVPNKSHSGILNSISTATRGHLKRCQASRKAKHKARLDVYICKGPGLKEFQQVQLQA